MTFDFATLAEILKEGGSTMAALLFAFLWWEGRKNIKDAEQRIKEANDEVKSIYKEQITMLQKHIDGGS